MGLMLSRNSTSGGRTTAFRFAVWLLPPHRKEWGEAMLNEAAYIKPRGAALQWVLGCVVTAFRERAAFELGRTFMTRRIFKVLLGLSAVLIVGAIGTYIDLKPYQRERIWITVREALHPDEPKRIVRTEDAPALEAPANSVQRSADP
jgi:hypothetical protein